MSDTLDIKEIQTYLKEHGDINLYSFDFLRHASLENHPLKEQLKAAQRLYRLCEAMDSVEALYNAGFHSAARIASLPEHRFIEQVGPLLGTEEGVQKAKSIHRNANARMEKALLTYIALSEHKAPHYEAMPFTNLAAPTDENFNGVPSYQELFGKLDFCTCPHCRSIFSPAAYFVDLVRLQKGYVAPGKDAIPLEKRRPDLGKITLSCENTHTLIPTLRIVNDVLRRTLAGEGNDTSKDPFESLQEAVYPLNLSFHLPLSTIRHYLKAGGTDLAALWETLRIEEIPHEGTGISTVRVAQERLGLSPGQWRLCSTPDTNNAGGRYGLKKGAQPLKALKNIDTFLQQTGLTLPGLHALLQCDLDKAEIAQELHKDSPVHIGEEPPIGIDSENGELTHLDPTRLDMINRIIRLSNILGISIQELIWVLIIIEKITDKRVVTKKGMDAALPYLAWIRTQSLQKEPLGVEELCGVLGTLKHWGRANGVPLFERVYAHPGIPNPPKWLQDKPLWRVPEGTEEKQPSPEDSRIKTALESALVLESSDLLRIAESMLQVQEDGDRNDRALTLDLENLSVLYRLSRLPTLIGLTIRECYIALELMPQGPGLLQKLAARNGKGVPKAVNSLQSVADWLKRSGLGLHEAQYMLCGRSEEATLRNAILGKDEVASFAAALRESSQPILFTPQHFLGVMDRQLPQAECSPIAAGMFHAALCEKGIIDSKTSKVQKKVETAQIFEWLSKNKIFPKSGRLEWLHESAELLSEIVNDLVGDTLEVTNLILQSTPALSPYRAVASLCATLEGVLIHPLNEALMKEASASGLMSHAFDTPDLSETSHRVLLESILGAVKGLCEMQGQNLYGQLSKLFNVPLRSVPILYRWSGLNAGALVADGETEEALSRLRTMQHHAYLVNRLSLSPVELEALDKHPDRFSLLKAENRPVFDFESLRALVKFKSCVHRWRDSKNRLLEYFERVNATQERPSPQKAASMLAEIAGWSAEEVLFLMRRFWPNTCEKLSETADVPWGEVKGIERIENWIAQARCIHADVGTLGRIADLGLSSEAGYAACGAVADSLWGGLGKAFAVDPARLKAIADGLETQKRDAMLGLCIHIYRCKGLPVHNADDLGNLLLIDVNVSSKVETSLVREAISSLQRYLNRCLNNLEHDVTIHEALLTLWEWMSTYRVWEANRKVFLYPENYLSPELRKDKTPLFAQLESDLQQGSPTDPTLMEKAFNNYLNRFLEVSNLEIISSGMQDFTRKEGAFKEVFILGRTPHETHKYFYLTGELIKKEKTQASPSHYLPVRWSTWNEVTAVFQKPLGNISPVYAFGKWYLFWVESIAVASQGDHKQPHYNYQLKCSYLDLNRRWSETRTLKNRISGNPPEKCDPKQKEVYPIYFHSTKEMLIPFENYTDKQEEKEFVHLKEGNSGNSPRYAIRYLLFKAIPHMGECFVYLSPMKSTTEFNYSKASEPFSNLHIRSLAFWFKHSETRPSKYQKTVFCGKRVFDGVKRHYRMELTGYKDLTLGGERLSTPRIEQGKWHHLAVNFSLYRDRVTYDSDVSCTLLNGNIFCLYKDESTLFCSKNNPITGICNRFRIVDSHNNPIHAHGIEHCKITTHENRLYIAWAQKEDRKNSLYYGHLTESSETFVINPILIDTKPTETGRYNSLQMALFNGAIYIAWSNYADRCVTYKNMCTNRLCTLKDQVDGIVYLDGLSAYQNKLVAVTNYGYSVSTQHQGITFIGFIASKEQEHESTQFKTFLDTEQKRITLSQGSETLYALYSAPDEGRGMTDDGAVVYRRTLTIDEKGKKFVLKEDATDTYTTISRQSARMCGFWADSRFYISRVLGSSTVHREMCISETGPAVYFDGFPVKRALHASLAAPIGLHDIFEWSETEEGRKDIERQEVFIYTDRMLLPDEVRRIYQNSRGKITDYAEPIINGDKAFKIPSRQIHILNQPNWRILGQNAHHFLASAYNHTQFTCIRLGTTALGHIIHQSMLYGTGRLFSTDMQSSPEVPFASLQPDETFIPKETHPQDTVDFFASPMSGYYRELFFYAPLLIASKLKTDLHHKEAKWWFERVFNPTISQEQLIGEGDQYAGEKEKYWRFLPLRSRHNPTLRQISDKSPGEQFITDSQDAAQLLAYHEDPFNPHAIATLRPIAYQKNVMMHYVENLFTWSDRLYREYTPETVMDATILYLLCADLFGKKPIDFGPCPLPAPTTLSALIQKHGSIDKVPEFLIVLEQTRHRAPPIHGSLTPHNFIANAYFGIPENDQIIAYHDKIQQRLYNIRHGRDIDGVERKMALFDPSLSPMQLVSSVASGAGADGVHPGIPPLPPQYRSKVLIDRAKEAAQTLVSFGSALRSALEKKDAEELVRLRQTRQVTLLSLTRASREGQVKEAEKTILALQKGQKNAQMRKNHYQQLFDYFISPLEIAAIVQKVATIPFYVAAIALKNGKSVLKAIPNIYGMAFGGHDLGESADALAQSSERFASILGTGSEIASTIAGYERRRSEWALQKDMAAHDEGQIKYQIEAAELHLKIANQELKILETTAEGERQVDSFLQSKFTNAELYQWMAGRLSALYFQLYRLAHDLAIQAEVAWRFESGSEERFIHCGYWDDLHRGLLSGEGLMLDLQRLQGARLKESRKLEITKTVSLAMLNPMAFNELKTQGSCAFELMEKDFDLDYPGHYFRQIKSISLTLPALTGPYESIHATLTQTSNITLLKPDVNGVRYLLTQKEKGSMEGVLRRDVRVNEQITLSQGVNDHGLFELSYSDPQYLPFEGTGAVSTWTLEMPRAFNTIDFETLSDVIVTIRYTARTGDANFRKSVVSHLGKFEANRPFLFAQDFPEAWRGCLRDKRPMRITLTQNQFRRNLSAYSARGFVFSLVLNEAGRKKAEVEDKKITLTLEKGENQKMVAALSYDDGTMRGAVPCKFPLAFPLKLTIGSEDELLNEKYVENLMMIVSYDAEFPN